VVSKLHVAETTIDSLNQQLVELSRSESLTRAREQHESVVNTMKKKHEEQVLELKHKLDQAVLLKDQKVPKISLRWGKKTFRNLPTAKTTPDFKYMTLYVLDQNNGFLRFFFSVFLLMLAKSKDF